MTLRPRAVLAAACLLCASTPALAAPPACTPASEARVEAAPRKGPGLRGLLAAARRAGTGELLGHAASSGGSRASYATAALGAVLEASDGASPADLAARAAAWAGNGSGARAAGAAVAMASELAGTDAASAAPAAMTPCTPSAPPAPAAVWN